MYKIIVATHGRLARGFEDSLIMIMGEQEDIDFISFMPEDTVSKFEDRLKRKIENIDKEKEILILTDLFGGTPNNVVSKYHITDPNRIKVVSGINFAMLIEAVMRKNESIQEVLDEIVENSIKGIVKVKFDNSSSDDDE